mgnify:CR=1 FL=1
MACLLRSRKTPLVVTQHNDSIQPSARFLARTVIRRAAAVVVPSRAHMALSRELESFENKTDIIPFGIDETRWIDLPRRGIDAPPRAIFIGRLVKFKGLDVLLRALERVPDLRLDIVGAGPEGHGLRTLTQALALTDRVKWFGEYPDEDLPRRMAEADFLVLPSVTVEERFGIVLLEAMAAGRPIITTAVPTGVRGGQRAGRDRTRGAVAGRGGAGGGAGDSRARSVQAGTDGRRGTAAGREVFHPRTDGPAAHRTVRAGARLLDCGSSGSRLARQSGISGTSMF